MNITTIFSFLVHPGKGAEEQQPIGGARVPRQGRLFSMLSAMFEDAERECEIEVAFRPDARGLQNNACHALLLSHVQEQTLTSGRLIAARLQSVTTNRSGLGLLFVLTGADRLEHKLLLSRFPADQGVVAQETGSRLNVEFIERVFMRSAKAYKSATYRGVAAAGSFLDGRAIDRQVNASRELSNYWIGEFLDSELRTTPAAGTKRIAVALRDAIRNSVVASIRQELVAFAQLLRGQDGRIVSPTNLVESHGLSSAARDALIAQLPRQELATQSFRFDCDEFDRHVAYRAVELENGGVLIAENRRFDEIFPREPAPGDSSLVRFSTESRVSSETLRKTR